MLTVQHVAPVLPPTQLDGPQFGPELVEVDLLVRAADARRSFNVDGAGQAVAVLDTGLRVTHVDFAGRVPVQRNFTADNGGNPDDAADGQGHGTNVAGIIAAGSLHIGIAPRADVIPLKVLSNTGSGNFESIRDALAWVKANHEARHIGVVCMSLGDGGNYVSDSEFDADDIRALVRDLRAAGVAVVVAAGNDYFTHRSQQGMGYPAIFRETVSVGAVYDADEGGFAYSSGAEAFATAPDRITPFSQRLHQNVNEQTRTDIFAPGAPVTSSGIRNDRAESIQHGTSQATPVTAGVLLLMQQYYRGRTGGQLPSVDDLVTWLRSGARPIVDGDDEDDNVVHTGLEFLRIDAVRALDAVRRGLQKQMLATGEPLRGTARTASA